MKMYVKKNLIKKVCETVKAFSDEVTFQMNEKGLNSRQMDKSQIAMIEFKIPNTSLTKWEGDFSKGDQLYTISLEKFLQVLSKSKGGDIDIELGDQVEIKSGQTKARLNRILSSNALGKELKATWETEIKVKENIINEAIDVIEIISPHILFSHADTLLMGGENSEKEDVEINTFSPTKPDVVKPQTYSLEYIKSFVKHLDKESEVKLSFGEKETRPLPLKIKGVVEGIEMTLYLAPRVEDQ